LGAAGVPVPPAIATRGDMLMGIRAENIEADTTEGDGPSDAFVSRTQVVELLGSQMLVTARVGDQPIKVLVRADAPIGPNEDLWLRPEADKVRWFDPETREAIPVD
jgi:multiple sugar transport system ATP-binding protein